MPAVGLLETPRFWVRHGGVPSYDLIAKPGRPQGLRIKGPLPALAQEALLELKDRGFLKKSFPRLLELGKSFYSIKSRHGASLNGVLLKDEMSETSVSSRRASHPTVPLAELPRCRKLLHAALELLGRDWEVDLGIDGDGQVPPVLDDVLTSSSDDMLRCLGKKTFLRGLS